jgi:uncharacterized protein
MRPTLFMEKTMNDVKRPGRSRRLRKKLFLDEFATEGFEVDFEFTAEKDADQLDVFIAEFMEGPIDSNDLVFFGSGCAESITGVIISSDRYSSVTTAQRQAVNEWLDANSDVSSVECGELTDSNNIL